MVFGIDDALGLAGGLLSGIGANEEGKAKSAAYGEDADTKRAEADEAVLEGAENERRLRIAAGKQIGGERAAIGASGIKTEGSALDVLQESAANAELDALTVRHQADLKAWGLRRSAAASDAAAAAAKSQGGFGLAAGLIKGVGSLF